MVKNYYKKIRENINTVNQKIVEKGEKLSQLLKKEEPNNKVIQKLENDIEKLKNNKEKMLANIDTTRIDDNFFAILEKYKFDLKDIKKTKEDIEKAKDEEEILTLLNKIYQQLETKLENIVKFNTQIRTLDEERIEDYYIEKKIKKDETKMIKISKKVSMFESFLTRTLEIRTDAITEDIFIIDISYHDIFEQIVKNGFYFKNRFYTFFTSSAGQIRDEKIMAINQDIYKTKEKTLMCGLSVDAINGKGGCNVTKFLAYLALTNSATDEFKEFDIDECIVVDDFATTINEEVDYIDTENFTITPTKEDIEITHTDGCGMCLPDASKKAFVFRGPWLKGLVVPFDFVRFVEKHENAKHIIKDIYNDEWNILSGECLTDPKASGKPIKYIFTKSMFKMCKFYDNWHEYKQAYKQYGCTAGICSQELAIKEYKDKQMPYQMLQTLDLTDDEIDTITKKTIKQLELAHKNIKAMQRIVNAGVANRNAFQQAFALYPEIIKDPHFRNKLQKTIYSRKKEAKAGKIELSNSKYVFIAPDLYAFCEWLFCDIDKPEGLLEKGEVFCKLYTNNQKLDACRNPHLSFEHAVRTNKLSRKAQDWFNTTCIYTSIHDPISKILQFDVDGDIALVIADPTIIEAAERKNVRPLYYKMTKAEAEEINNESIFASLKKAFEYGGKIGEYSNMISKLWNKEDRTKEDEDLIKILTCLTNFSIDAAKTKYMPEVKDWLKEKIKKLKKEKLPYFFKYAKDKKDVSDVNNSTVNRICKRFEELDNEKFEFPNVRFSRKILMNNFKIAIDERVVQIYEELDKTKNQFFNKYKDAEEEKIKGMYNDLKQEFFNKLPEEYKNKEKDVVDMLIKHLGRKTHKTLLWELFGDIIVANIKKNRLLIKEMRKKANKQEYIKCAGCGKEIVKNSNSQKYCKRCAKKFKHKKIA